MYSWAGPHTVSQNYQTDSLLGVLSSEDLINHVPEDRALDTPLSDVELQGITTCSAASHLREVISKRKRTHQYKFLVTDGDG